MGKSKSKIKINYSTSEQTEMRKLFVIVLIVMLIVSGSYLLTRAFVTKDLKDMFKKEQKTEEVITGEIDYDSAIVGNMLDKPYSNYYVVVYSSTGDYAYDMSSLVESYTKLKKHNYICTVDLDEYMNKKFYDAENVNLKVTDVNDYKFGDITLLKVKNGKVEKYFTDYTKMKKELGI